MCNHSSSYGYCNCNGYAQGYRDGLLQGQREQEALDGPDRTMYLMVGGPKHGERIETQGKMTVYVPIVRPHCLHLADGCNNLMNYRCGHACCDPIIRTGRYERTLTSKGVTVYRWKG